MSENETARWASHLARTIGHAIEAHHTFPRTAADSVRFHDQKTPYAVHPIWCAMTFLTETALPEELRRDGADALLWHDLLEDSTLPLPDWTSERVRGLVKELTFPSFKEELETLWFRSEEAILLKLYDKTSNLLDGTWMRDAQWNRYVAHTVKIADHVEAKWGALNGVRMARAIAIPREIKAQATAYPRSPGEAERLR
ncbi:MAG: hypothetical protein V9G98_26010 [Candidatus Competibacter sp.]